MFINKIKLENFRNFQNFGCDFENGINVICGKNASGKTNILEAISFLSLSKSIFNIEDTAVIKFENSKACVCANIMDEFLFDIKMELEDEPKKQKKFFINSVEQKKLADFVGVLKIIFFSPDDLKLIKGCGDDRRRFLNVSLCQMNKEYFLEMQRFNRILLQRNQLLKSDDKNIVSKTLETWDEAFSNACVKISNIRNIFIKSLAKIANEKFKNFFGERAEITIHYESGAGIKDFENETEQKQAVIERLKENRSKDIMRGFTGLGVQRDDFEILLDGKTAQKFSSQGQKRTMVLCLKLSEIEIFVDKKGTRPVLLLDDVFGELDEERQKILLEQLKNFQTIITTTSADGLEKCENIIKI